jgi:DNA-binding transcriptional LysR family regulator
VSEKNQAINLKSLECFLAIIETGSATAAAERIGITQPGVSRLLAVLEHQVGFSLFYREKGRLIPTQEAHVLYPEIDQALANLSRISSLAANLHDFQSGRLNIVAPPSLMEGPLAELVNRYLKLYPRIRVTLDACRAEEAKDQVLKRAADCGVIKLPVTTPGLDCVPLFESGTVCAMAATHSLAKQGTVSISMLDGEPLVLLGKGSRFRDALEQSFQNMNSTMKVRLDVHTVGSACAFARLGVGIAILNGTLASHYTDSALVTRPLNPEIKHEYGFVSASHVPVSRATQAFLDLCIEYFRV